jgi:hypothetical protein
MTDIFRSGPARCRRARQDVIAVGLDGPHRYLLGAMEAVLVDGPARWESVTSAPPAGRCRSTLGSTPSCEHFQGCFE